MATLKFVQAQKFSLAGSGSSIGDTTIVLQSMVGIDGSNIVTADIGVTCFGTLEPGNGTQEEAISFTGITQNSNGTATLTGVSSVLFKAPYTATSGLTKTHAGASTFILSNDAAFYGAILDYVDAAIVSGGVPATTTVLGLTKMSVTPASAASPIAVGDNDPRMLTATQASSVSNLAPYFSPIQRTYPLASSGAIWTKPSGLKYLNVELWGGGGAGGSANGGAAGGGGGAYVTKRYLTADLASSYVVSIASGGLAVTGASGGPGATTTLGSLLSSYGGGGGFNGNGGGGGGGTTAVGGGGTTSKGGGGGGLTGGVATGANIQSFMANSTYGGGSGCLGGAGLAAGQSIFGGGGGMGGGDASLNPGAGNSYYGGGGGAGAGNSGNTGGTSVFGGAGGNATAGAGGAGTVPSGGGAGSATVGTASGAGAAGQATITEYYA